MLDRKTAKTARKIVQPLLFPEHSRLSWNDRRADLLEIAEPILKSPAFLRLGNVTFLGILSPRFSRLVDSPIRSLRESRFGNDDGTRLDHSLGVAVILLDLCRRFNWSDEAKRYCVAWGLLHDIATWPLSHTGEAAFSKLTGTKSRQLRTQIITASQELPSTLCLSKALHEIGVDGQILLHLFEENPSSLSEGLLQIWQIVHSPMTPDSLEGIWRSGAAFGTPLLHPGEVLEAIVPTLYEPVVSRRGSKDVISFWRTKSTIYRRFINNPKVVRWESAWSLALIRDFKNIDLAESLRLKEMDIIKVVLERGLPDDVSLVRYKAPLDYSVEPARKRVFKTDESVSKLDQTLQKRRRKDIRP